ncbi:chemotaxis protein CheA [candidate division KSB1 bacterium]
MIDSTKNNSSNEIEDPFEGLSDEDVAELLEVFFEDISEKIESLTSLIIDLEEQQEKSQTVNSIFQIYHSLKGTVGTFGFPSLSIIFHKLEYLVEDVRDGRMSITSELVDLFLQTVDKFKKIVTKIKSRRPTVDEEKEMLEIIERFGRDISVPDDTDIPVYSHKEIIDSFREEAEDFIKLRTAKIDTIIALSSELIQRKRYDSVHLKRLSKVLTQIKHEKLNLMKGNGSRIDEHSVNNLNELQKFMELVIGDVEYWKNSTARLLDDLQHEVLQARMVELNEFFKQLKRTIRDIVKNEQKKVRLLFAGMDTEIDRTVMEEIKDPVIHIIRNAVDHGIETPEERKQLGKREEAVISVSAIPSGDEVRIEIEDDGRGIDINSLKKTAIQKRIISSAEAENLTDQQAVNLIFKPGFSTKSTATEVSGRGVGMDVVKTNVDKIHGIVTVETQKGKGTKFTLNLPATLTAFPALLSQAGDYYFYIQLIAVDRLIRIPAGYKWPGTEITSVTINDETMPFIFIGDYFNISRNKVNKSGSYIIILRSGGSRIALEVDECFDQHDIVLKPAPDIVSNIRSLAGISILPDGQLAYVIDPSELMTQSQKRTNEKESWALDDLTFELPFDSYSSPLRTVFSTDTGESSREILTFNLNKQKYGIPLNRIEQICDLRNEDIAANLNELYDSVIVLKDDRISLIMREELKNPLKLERWIVKGSAFLIKTESGNSLLIPDSIGSISFLDKKDYTTVEKAGKWQKLLPEVFILEEENV